MLIQKYRNYSAHTHEKTLKWRIEFIQNYFFPLKVFPLKSMSAMDL